MATATSAPTPKFPVPKRYFDERGPALTDAQRAAYCATAKARIDAVVRAERTFVLKHERQISSSQWKLIKKQKKQQHELRIFQRRRRTSVVERSTPTLLAVGRMTGTLEDLIYGTYDKSTDEMKTTMAFVDMFTKDCAVLHNLELATAADPFHYVGIKWTLSQLPGKLFVKPRDWCYIEAMGIDYDAAGHRFGYTIVHTVDDVPNCPPFGAKDVVRGQGSLSFVYREAEDAPGVITIYAEGLFNPAGRTLPLFAILMSCEIFSGQALTVRCAEAKKLTLLALRNVQAGRRCATNQSASVCYRCGRPDRRFASLKVCAVCSVLTCDKCRVKRHIFMGATHAVCAVTCCQRCVVDAQNLVVRPAEPAFALHASPSEPLLPTPVRSVSAATTALGSSTTSWPTQNVRFDSVSTSASGGDNVCGSPATNDGNDDIDDDYHFSRMNERDFEKIIEAMIDERLVAAHRTGPSSSSSSSSSSRTGSYPYPLDVASPSAAVAVPQSPVLPDEQAAMLQKMLELQLAASQVFQLTQANEEMMRKL